jgi:hypothetical protein
MQEPTESRAAAYSVALTSEKIEGEGVFVEPMVSGVRPRPVAGLKKPVDGYGLRYRVGIKVLIYRAASPCSAADPAVADECVRRFFPGPDCYFRDRGDRALKSRVRNSLKEIIGPRFDASGYGARVSIRK